MPTDQETFEAMTGAVVKHFPKYKVIAKESSWLHKLIGWTLKTFTPNKVYMFNFWTYFGGNNAYPIESTPGERFRSWRAHVHEGTHAGQEKKWTGFLWGSLYLLGTPVYALVFLILSLPLFVVGGLVAAVPWWIGFCVLGLGLILSIPVPFGYFRGRWELQGFGASIATRYWTGESVDNEYIENRVDLFANGTYFWMCTNKKKVRRELKRARSLVEKKEFMRSWLPYAQPFYSTCYNTLKSQGRLKV